MRLLSFPWAILYIPDDPRKAWFFEKPGTRTISRVPDAALDEVAELRQALIGRKTKSLFRVSWGDPPETLRIKALATAHNTPLFICRRPIGRGKPRPMTELGFPPALVSRLLDQEVLRGVILFLGPQKSGKTTSAGCFCVDYASRHGGILNSIENPIEMDLEGHHGPGLILQSEIDDEIDMGSTLRGMLHSGASLVYCGEIIRDDVASEVLSIGLALPIVSTYHSHSLVAGLRRISEAAGGRHSLLAECLTAAFFLTLIDDENGSDEGSGSRLIVSPLMLFGEGQQAEHRIRTHIRNGNYEALGNEIERQERNLMNMRG